MLDSFGLRIFNLLAEPLVHFLCCAHDNTCTRTHDAIHYIFVNIARNASFHMGRKQLHTLSSTTFNFLNWQVNIVFTKNGIRILVDVVIVDPM
jgi:hypothetical protein